MEAPRGPSDPILKSRRYVLGEEEDSFAIWDREAPGEPIERFPATSEGFEEAEAQFRKLSRDARLGRVESSLATVFIVGIAAGAVMWTGGWLLLIFLNFGLDPTLGLQQTGFAIEGVGFRLVVTTALLGFGSIIARRAQPARPGARSTRLAVGGLERPLVGTIVVGLVIWIIAGAIATLFPAPLFGTESTPGFLSVEDPRFLGRAASFAEAIAFRVWVAAAVLLGLRWTWRWRAAGAFESHDTP